MQTRLILLVLAICIGGATLPLKAQTAAPAEASLKQRLEALREEHDVPALGAALLRDGQVVELAVVGNTRAGVDEPVGEDDAWHIGSCTKAITATVAARLIEQGKLDWDTPLADGLPELADQMNEAYRGVTLRQLLGHRGGIIGHEANAMAMPMLWGLERQNGRPMRDRRIEAAKQILNAPPAGHVGVEFRYSNYGYLLAGAMLERAGDADWEDLVRREVFEPLGITAGGFGPPPRILGHIRSNDAWQAHKRDNPLIMGPAGTVHMSLRDWTRFAAAHLGQVEGYLKPETLAKLHEPVAGPGASYALGWGVRPDAQGTVRQLSHAGSNTMWYAVIELDPGKGEARLAATNAVGREAADAALKALVE